MDNGAVFYELLQNLFSIRNGSLMAYYDVTNKVTKTFQISSTFYDIYQKFLEINNVGTMAFENAEDYAKSFHDHDNYTSATYQVYQDERLSDLLIEFGNGYKMYNFKQTVDHSQEVEDEYKKFSEKIGSVRFVSSTKTDMEGWVSAGGQILDASLYEHGEVLSTYYGTGSGCMFKVPNLSGFWKPFISTEDGVMALSAIDGYSCTLSHTHQLNSSDAKISIKSISDISVDGNNYIGSTQSGSTNTKYGTTHHGKQGTKSTDIIVDREANFSDDNFSTTIKEIAISSTTRYDQDNNTETYPQYQTLPAYIYIGKTIS